MKRQTSAAILLGALLLVFLALVLFIPLKPTPLGPPPGKSEEAPPSLARPPLPSPAPLEETASPPAVPAERSVGVAPESSYQGPVYPVEGRAFLHDRFHPLRFATLSWVQVEENSQTAWTEIKTDDAARFRVDFVRAEEVSLTFRHLDYEPLTFELKLPQPPGTELELVFTSGITVTGVVKNREGRPLPRALIFFWKRMGERKIPAWTCTSDEEGRYRQGGFEEGKYRVTIKGVAPYRTETKVKLSAEYLQEVDLVFDCPPPLLVQVLSQEGEPVPGMEVQYSYSVPGAGGSQSTQPTDAGGWTSVHCIPEGCTVTLKAGDEESGTGVVASAGLAGNEPVVLRLEPWRMIAGEVIGVEGEPVAAVSVEITEVLANTQHGHRPLKTDAEGRFEGRLAQGEYRLEVAAGEWGSGSLSVLVEGEGPLTDLQIRLERPSTVHFRVTGAHGVPVEGARMRLRLMPKNIFVDGGSDAEGFLTCDLQKGSYELRVHCEGFFSLGPVPLEVPAPNAVEIRLDPFDARSIAGTVLDGDQPVPGARVFYLSLKDGFPRPREGAVSDPAGNFRLTGIVGEQVRLCAFGPGFGYALSEAIEVPNRGHVEGGRVVVLPGVDLEAHLKDPSGDPLAELKVFVRTQSKPEFGLQASTDRWGFLRIERLPPGEYFLVVEGEEGKFSSSLPFHWDGTPPPQSLVLEWEEE